MNDAEIVATLRAEWSNHMDFPADPDRNVRLIEKADALLYPEYQQ